MTDLQLARDATGKVRHHGLGTVDQKRRWFHRPARLNHHVYLQIVEMVAEYAKKMQASALEGELLATISADALTAAANVSSRKRIEI